MLFWYIQNEQEQGEGEGGLLAISEDPETARSDGPRASYRVKKRLAVRAHERRDAESAKTLSEAAPAFRSLGENERMRRKFRRQDEARYRVKDRAVKYNPGDDPSAP